jgi:hypothetical protein
MRVQHLAQIFPKLDESSLAITSPRTNRYNCVAYAAGDDRRWWWPDPDGISYWPPGAQRRSDLVAFEQAFGTIGYALAADGKLEAGYEKIAIYAVGSKPTHAAKQLPDGKWSSKLGALEDISHQLEGVENNEYGAVAFFMKRKR